MIRFPLSSSENCWSHQSSQLLRKWSKPLQPIASSIHEAQTKQTIKFELQVDESNNHFQGLSFALVRPATRAMSTMILILTDCNKAMGSAIPRHLCAALCSTQALSNELYLKSAQQLPFCPAHVKFQQGPTMYNCHRTQRPESFL